MTFKELLEARNEAYGAHEQSASARLAAQEALDICLEDEAKRLEAKLASDRAIVERLEAKGVHVITARDGTITTYHLSEPKSDDDPGWCAMHPIPGEGVE